MENQEFSPTRELSNEQGITSQTTFTQTAGTEVSLKKKILNRFGFLRAYSKKSLAVGLGVLLTIVTVVAIVYIRDSHVAVKQFTNVYSFVPEKISKSAAIQINLPEGVSMRTGSGRQFHKNLP